jgi:hypothetical protein
MTPATTASWMAMGMLAADVSPTRARRAASIARRGPLPETHGHAGRRQGSYAFAACLPYLPSR